MPESKLAVEEGEKAINVEVVEPQPAPPSEPEQTVAVIEESYSQAATPEVVAVQSEIETPSPVPIVVLPMSTSTAAPPPPPAPSAPTVAPIVEETPMPEVASAGKLILQSLKLYSHFFSF